MDNERAGIDEIQNHAREIEDGVSATMHGMKYAIRLCLVALYSKGHVLLEGNPGLGKTSLVRALAAALRVRWGRLQFVPDLMPSDIIGTYTYEPDRILDERWEFREGPIFKPLLLADEINRASPKTQAAMLEGMEERKVTTGRGETRDLPSPFMVLATQNPIEHEGTYKLPEAQSDRFMFKINIDFPDGGTLKQIVEKEAGPVGEDTRPLPITDAEQSKEARRVEAFHKTIRAEDPIPTVGEFIHNLLMASNGRFDELKRVKDKGALEDLSKLMAYGVGPRAGYYLMRGTKAWSTMFPGEKQQIREANQVRALACIALPTLRHRAFVHFGWEEAYWKRLHPREPVPEDGYPTGFLDEMLTELCIAAFPVGEFREVFGRQIHKRGEDMVMEGL